MSTTKHVVLSPSKLSPEQLAKLEADYDRDVALAPKGEAAGEAQAAGDQPAPETEQDEPATHSRHGRGRR